MGSLVDALADLGSNELFVIDPFTGHHTSRTERAFQLIRLPRLSVFGGASPNVATYIQSAIDRVRPDILHVHLAAQYTQAHSASVLTVHGLPHVDSRLRHSRLRGHVSGKILERSFLIGIRNASRVIAISNEIERAAESAGVPSIQIPNAIRGDFFDVRRNPGHDFITVGSVTPAKNQAFLIRAFREYVESGGAGKLRVVGGIGDRQYLRLCQLESAGIEERVEFTGQVELPKLLRMLAEARAWVSPSLRETSSVALSEALAANCPVVTFDVGTAAEQVDSKSKGIVLPSRASTHELARALHEVRLPRPSGSGSSVYRQHPKAVARATLDVYRSVML